jgi:hypothetical protein
MPLLTITANELLWIHGETGVDRVLLEPRLDALIDIFLLRAVTENYIPKHALAAFILYFQYEPRYFRIVLFCYGHCNLQNPLKERYLWYYLFTYHLISSYSSFFYDFDD